MFNNVFNSPKPITDVLTPDGVSRADVREDGKNYGASSLNSSGKWGLLILAATIITSIALICVFNSHYQATASGWEKFGWGVGMAGTTGLTLVALNDGAKKVVKSYKNMNEMNARFAQDQNRV